MCAFQGKKAKKAAAGEQLDVEADAEEEAELARMREAGFAIGAEAKGAAAPAVCSGAVLCWIHAIYLRWCAPVRWIHISVNDASSASCCSAAHAAMARLAPASCYL